MVDLKITTYPNTEVKLQGDKVARTLISDDQGVAIFKRLKGGTYTATAKGKTKEIAVVSEQTEALCKQVKDLPLKSKIKFSSGLKMILMIKDAPANSAEPHQPNSACLISEYVTEEFNFVNDTSSHLGIDYAGNVELQNLLMGYLEKLTWQERRTILYRVLRTHFNDSMDRALGYFYLMSPYELGADIDESFPSWGFPDNKSRIRKFENGKVSIYFTRYIQSSGDQSSVAYISATGTREIEELFDKGDSWKAGIVPACDISQDAYVALDSDGYYRILGM